MGLRVQSTVGCFPELWFFYFSVAQGFEGLRKQFINNFVFLTRVCAADFNNNNNDMPREELLILEQLPSHPSLGWEKFPRPPR